MKRILSSCSVRFFNPNTFVCPDVKCSLLDESFEDHMKTFKEKSLGRNLGEKEDEISVIDIHGHSFNCDYAPHDVIPERLFGRRLINSDGLWSGAVKLLKGISSLLERYPVIPEDSFIHPNFLHFIRSASKSSGELLDGWISDLEKAVNEMEKLSGEVIVLSLPIDMDLGYEWDSIGYIEGFQQIREDCKNHNESNNTSTGLHAFALDPRKLESHKHCTSLPNDYEILTNYPAEDLDHRVEEYVEYIKDAIEGGAVACKMYPGLGFRPTHPILMNQIYPIFEECGIPIISHCTKGGLETSYDDADILDFFEVSPTTVDLGDWTPRGDKNHNFAHPQRWEMVFEQFPNLKVDLAHFGGVGEVLLPDTDILYADGFEVDWDEEILHLMSKYDHVYSDISNFTSSLEIRMVFEFCEKYGVMDRLLWGSDFWMSRAKKSPGSILKTVGESVPGIWEDGRRIVLKENAIRFLRP